jgi:hypothetical protein
MNEDTPFSNLMLYRGIYLLARVVPAPETIRIYLYHHFGSLLGNRLQARHFTMYKVACSRIIDSCLYSECR